LGGLKELLSRFRAGEERAFDAIVAAAGPSVLRTAYLYLGAEDPALDAAQETFLEAYRLLGSASWTGPGGVPGSAGAEAHLAGWLRRTALNKAREIARRAVRFRADAERLSGPGAREARSDEAGRTPAESAERAERRSAVRRALAELPDRQREVVILRHFEGLTFREIADDLGIAEATARVTFHQALSALRRRLSGTVI
jgi:RNA polymerase sigma-70 factor (ECF subfamily)